MYPDESPFMTTGELNEALEGVRANNCPNLLLVLSVEEEIAGAAEDTLTLARNLITSSADLSSSADLLSPTGLPNALGPAEPGGLQRWGDVAPSPRLQICLRNLLEEDPEEGSEPGYTQWLELRLHLDRESTPGIAEQVLQEQQDILGNSILRDHRFLEMEVDAEELGELNRN